MPLTSCRLLAAETHTRTSVIEGKELWSANDQLAVFNLKTSKPVNGQVAGSANIAQVNAKLTQHSTNDTYMLVGGRSADGTNLGVSKVDLGNTKDNVAFTFAEDLLDKATSLAANDVNHWEYLVSTLARTAAHEAAHTFGLDHLIETSE